MNDLINVSYTGEQPAVSGRELHAALEIKTAYKDWFPRMCEYGFTEGEDYFSILRNRSDRLPGKPLTDHQLTIPMAKELCMLQLSLGNLSVLRLDNCPRFSAVFFSSSQTCSYLRFKELICIRYKGIPTHPQNRFKTYLRLK